MGAIGEEAIFVNDEEDTGYAKQTIKNGNANEKNIVEIKHFPWSHIEKETKLRVDTVIMDCEGCWVDIVDTYTDRFQTQIKTIILGRLIGNEIEIVKSCTQ